MLIGLDFDNTIVRYDQLFHRLAVERGLIPASLPVTKQAVRDALRSAGSEDEWTELQGVAYGPRITDAEPFAGVKRLPARPAGKSGCASASSATRRGIRIAARNTTSIPQPTHSSNRTASTPRVTPGCHRDRVYLELTLAAKLARIGVLGCTTFVDDLPEVLAERAFPSGVRKVLFDPANAYPDHPTLTRVTSWEQCGDLLVKQEACA